MLNVSGQFVLPCSSGLERTGGSVVQSQAIGPSHKGIRLYSFGFMLALVVGVVSPEPIQTCDNKFQHVSAISCWNLMVWVDLRSFDVNM